MCDNRNKFCFICGLFLDKNHRLKLEKNIAVVDGYNDFFKLNYTISDRWYEPEFACVECSSKFKKWKLKSAQGVRISFSSPMIWHHQTYHIKRKCYFCSTNVTGHQYKTRKNIEYADVRSITKPKFLRGVDKSIRELKKVELVDCHETIDVEDDEYLPSQSRPIERHVISNVDYQDLRRDLNLSIRQSELLASRLKQWKMVEEDFKITLPRNDERMTFEAIFKADEENEKLIYCADISALFDLLGYEHVPSEWRLFIDGSTTSKYTPNTKIMN